MPAGFLPILPCEVTASIKHHIKPGKGKDVYNCCGEHFIFASDAIAAPVAEMLSHFLKVCLSR